MLPYVASLALVIASLAIHVTLMPFTKIASYVVAAATSCAHPGLKQTALLVAYIRAEIARVGARSDNVTEVVLSKLPWAPSLATTVAATYLRLPVWHTLAKTFKDPYQRLYTAIQLAPTRGLRMEGFVRELLSVRTLAIDAAVATSNATQLVILGAGFDTRCYLDDVRGSRRCFEVDLLETQRAKREAIAAAGIDASHVTFVDVDFNKESWLTKLIARGFDASSSAAIIWEGVSYYLEPEAVAATADTFSQLAPGSTLTFDFFTNALISGEEDMPAVAKHVEALGEPLLYGIGDGDDAEEVRSSLVAWAKAHKLCIDSSGVELMRMGTEPHAAIKGGVATMRVGSQSHAQSEARDVPPAA